MSGTLYVVATPIGNLEDFSPRAQRALREVAVIAAEDTRVTRKLLQRFEISTPLTSFHAHSGSGKTGAILERLRAGEDVALVSDAGTPGVSDPGGELIGAAVAEGLVVVPIPGPSAVIAALSAGGLDPSRFYFHGFLPRSRGDRRRAVEPLRALPCTLVFYEAPGRLAETLGILAEALGNRRAVLAREITKKFEEFRRGSLSELQEGATGTEPRGECVILIQGASAQDAHADQPDSESLLRELLASGMSTRDAARAAAEQLGVPRKATYARALELSQE